MCEWWVINRNIGAKTIKHGNLKSILKINKGKRWR